MSQRFKKRLKPTVASNQSATHVQAKFQQALTLHQQGQLAQAQVLYEEILKVQPNNLEALLLSGEIAYQTQNLQRAVKIFDKAIAINPNNASFYNNRGLVLQELRQLDAALASYDKAIAMAPDYATAYNNRGNVLQELKQSDAALVSYDKAIAIAPDYADAYNNRGNVLQELKQSDTALASYDKAIAIEPDYADAYYNRGNVLKKLIRLDAALASYNKAIAIIPDYADAYYNRGNVLQKLMQLDAALASYDKAIAIKPDYADAYYNRGNVLQELKQLDAALASYDKVIALAPDYAEAYNNRGNVLQELMQSDAALASYDQAIAIKPDYADAYYNRGNVLKKLMRLDTALANYDKAIAINPDYAEAYNNRGNVLQELKQSDAALASYDRAIAIEPDYADAYYNRGNALKKLKRLDTALASYDKAIAIKPDYAEAYYNRGNALQELKQLDTALASYDKAIAIKPDYMDAYNNRGNVLQELKQLDAALASYDRAIAIEPDSAEAYYNRGNALKKLNHHQAAIESYAKALSIKPDYEFLSGSLLHSKMHICDWENAENQLAELSQKIQHNEKVVGPFPVLALSTSLPLQRKAAEIWVKEKHPADFELGNIPKRSRGEKIRLGYFSMDFSNHPVSFLTAELFEQHDRNRFEVYAFSFGPDTQDEMRQRIEGAFDRFIEVRFKSDQEVAEMARLMEIDIAIDLAGFTADSRAGIFSFRAAPVQINYLGYPGTMGADYMDYLIADKQLIPEDALAHYSEKIAFLPCFQANDSKRKISDRVFTREELGLPESGFVFCSFNKNYKITPSTFAGWMRILKRVGGSVLWLFADNSTAADNLRKEAVRQGVDARRLVFANRLSYPEYLARYRCADLFLDTLPFNAGTTASDALWAGLPGLTCTGEAFASRMAASLLTAILLPELITRAQEEYEDLAVELATDPERLKAIRQKLERNRLTTPLFDTRLFTRHLEDAYTQMYERYQADLPPDHIYTQRA